MEVIEDKRFIYEFGDFVLDPNERTLIAGDTPILLADGSVRPLAKLSVGDTVYGTDDAFFSEELRLQIVYLEQCAHLPSLKGAGVVRIR